MNFTFACDLDQPAETLEHFWEHTIGSCHAPLALRADWQKQLKRCHDELGFRHVRFHGLLSDDMGTLVNEQDKLIYSYFNLDQIFDFLRSIQMRPFIELSFMPEAIASGPDIVFHYKGNITPPKKIAEWQFLIFDLATHLVERYGREEVSHWFFEVWNEPNLKAFWTGTQKDYFHFYEVTASTLKRVAASLQVGGPATAKNEWIPEFVRFCTENEVPVDFISTHHYPTDAFGKPGDDTLTQLAESERSVLRQQTLQAKAEAQGKPLYYTEWSSSSNPFDELHDKPFAAAFVIKTVLEARGLVKAYSYWTFSDIFEENYFSSVPFHGGFGLLNIYGVPKPTYRAFEILHRLGNESIPVQGVHPTVDCWMARDGKKIQIVLTHFVLPRHEEKTETLTIELAGLPKIKSSQIERLDEDHANSRGAWEKMGNPQTLSPAQVEELEKSSRLVPEPIEVMQNENKTTLNVTLPPQGSALITLETA